MLRKLSGLVEIFLKTCFITTIMIVFFVACFPAKAEAAKKSFSFINTTTAITEDMQFQFSVNISNVKWSVNDKTRAKIRKDGTLIPEKPGWVTVKAQNKKSKKSIKQKVLIVDINGTVDTQKKLNAVLLSPYVDIITIQTEETREFMIDYPYDKYGLTLKAPNSTVTLYAARQFKLIKYIDVYKVNYLTEEDPVGPGALYRYFEAVVTNVYSKGEIEVESREDSYSNQILYFKKGERVRVAYEIITVAYQDKTIYLDSVSVGDIVLITYIPNEKLDKNKLYCSGISYISRPEFKAVVEEVYSEKEIQVEAKENLYFNGICHVQWGDKIKVSFDYIFTKYSPVDASREQIYSIKAGDVVIVPWMKPYGELNKDNLYSSEIYYDTDIDFDI